MRILVRTSRLATWAQRFASFAVPIIVISVLMHRLQTISTQTFHILGSLGLSLAVVAVLLSLAAFTRLWQTGDKGWGRAVAGFVLGGICASPLIFATIAMTRYPAVADVTTSPQAPLQMIEARPDVGLQADQSEIRAAFPNLVTRDYQINANLTYELVEELVAERRWQIISSQAPQLEQAGGQINAISMSLFGWRDEIAIRIVGGAGGAMVDMRSASLAGQHDLGQNGLRIEGFLVDLDAAVTVAFRDRPAPDAAPVPAPQRSNN